MINTVDTLKLKNLHKQKTTKQDNITQILQYSNYAPKAKN